MQEDTARARGLRVYGYAHFDGMVATLLAGEVDAIIQNDNGPALDHYAKEHPRELLYGAALRCRQGGFVQVPVFWQDAHQSIAKKHAVGGRWIMATVADVIKSRKPRELATLPPDATVRDALQVMADRGIGSVVVMDGELLEGIFTERDYARRIVLEGKHSADTRLIDVMTRRLYVVHEVETVQECLGIMTQARIRHLPVVADKQIIGLVSIGDLVNHMLEEQRFMIEQLESYIAGGLG